MGQNVQTQVLVVGAGNAALCAAIAARQRGANVLVLEKASREDRGGNSMHTIVMRFAYESIEDLTPLVNDISKEEIDLLSDPAIRYTQADYYNDMMWVTDGRSDPELCNTLVTESLPTIRWLRSLGQDWVIEGREGTPRPAHPVAMNGGGYGLQERAFAIAEKMGIQFSYDTRATELLQDNQGRVVGVRALTPQGFVNYSAKAVVMACGGFEANAEMRARYLGPNWDAVRPRGVPFNTGDGLSMALEIGALPYGSWSSAHASAQDLNLPPYMLPKDHLLCAQQWRYSYPYCITVNSRGQRFFDEGETHFGLTYAKFGRAILAQPGSVAFQIYDAKCREMGLIQPNYEKATGATSDTLEGLAEALGIDEEEFLRAVREYNEAVQPGEFQPGVLDGKGTRGITPAKSNWALTIDKPPFEGYPVVCGITFTFGGLKIDDEARVTHTLDRPIPGLYTAGEMVGGLFYWNYPGGTGMMSGAVFGRKAGANAAEYALTQ